MLSKIRFEKSRCFVTKVVKPVGLLLVLLLSSCSNRNAMIEKILKERDSLLLSLHDKSVEFENYEQAVEIMNATLDSIAKLENLIFLTTEESPASKEEMEYNLMRFETILHQQSEKVRQLEEMLSLSRDSTDQSMRLIEHLKEQIEVKNHQIAQLKSGLELNSFDLARMREKVTSQDKLIHELNSKSKMQMEALAVQDSILNSGYVLIASKRELRQMGLIKGRQLVSDALQGVAKFTAVDIRDWNEVCFQAARPRILTAMPLSSYEFKSQEDGVWMLNISNVPDFWCASRFLVIQSD